MTIGRWKNRRVSAKSETMNASMQPGLVSVIIPVYNRPELIVEAVSSVIAQSYRPLQLILVDDGSTDDTPRILAALADGYPNEITLVTTGNRGAACARESGRLTAGGEFIQYLDSDDLLLPDKLAVQVAALRERPDCDIAYCGTRLVDRTRNVLKEPFKGTGERREQLFPLLLAARWWSTQTPLYRRSLCDAIGAWSDLDVNEDWEYEARAGALRARLVYCPQILCETRQHDGRTTNAPFSAARVPGMNRLLHQLFDCACRAGVDRAAPEMRSFVGWAFENARRAHQMGLKQDALACFNLSVKVRRLIDFHSDAAAGTNGPENTE